MQSINPVVVNSKALKKEAELIFQNNQTCTQHQQNHPNVVFTEIGRLAVSQRTCEYAWRSHLSKHMNMSVGLEKKSSEEDA